MGRRIRRDTPLECLVIGVSIQLVSPASGEAHRLPLQSGSFIRFHSISFPSEWGDDQARHTTQTFAGLCFHSISFPSEWGALLAAFNEPLCRKVSIQLVSPASGELVAGFESLYLPGVAFPFN